MSKCANCSHLAEYHGLYGCLATRCPCPKYSWRPTIAELILEQADKYKEKYFGYDREDKL